MADPELAEALDRFGADGPAPFYTGDLAAAVVDVVRGQGGLLGAADLAAYRVIGRPPLRVPYRDATVCLNPPPSAGGALLGGRCRARPHTGTAGRSGPRRRDGRGGAGAHAGVPGGARRAVDIGQANRLGSTTHVSVLDADGWACAVTSSNGEGFGRRRPGTGIHLNNVLGEADLSPLGFHRQRPGGAAAVDDGADGGVARRRRRAGRGLRRVQPIRSAVLQVIVNVLDGGMTAQAAVDAPRLHLDGDELYAEPGVADLAATGLPVTTFRAPNLFFGGCQAVARHPATGALSGGADARRGGAVRYAP